MQDCSRFMQIGSQMPSWFWGSPLQLKPLLQTGIHNNLWYCSAPQIYLCTNVYISCAYVCKLFDQIILQGFKFHEISTSTNFTEFKYHKKPTIQYMLHHLSWLHEYPRIVLVLYQEYIHIHTTFQFSSILSFAA